MSQQQQQQPQQQQQQQQNQQIMGQNPGFNMNQNYQQRPQGQPYGMNGPGQMSQGAKILDVIRQNDPKDPKVNFRKAKKDKFNYS